MFVYKLKPLVKQLFAAILILSIFSFQFSELLVYSVFKINQDYIAKNLCVEKDVEDSTCNGCCHLKKKVNEQNEQKKELPPVQNNKQNINFCKQNCELNLVLNEGEDLLLNRNLKEYQFVDYHSIFHPPEEVI